MSEITFPVMNVKMVPANKVIANVWNPNRVASLELDLLEHSIREDGVTQPIVTFYDAESDRWQVVDGFHRWTILTKRLKCEFVPVVEIDKDIKNRMASTIRHNRARGKHQVDLMADIVINLLKLGWADNEIAEHLGMEAEEVLRLKQQTGFAELYKKHPFSRSWEDVSDVECEPVDAA